MKLLQNFESDFLRGLPLFSGLPEDDMNDFIKSIHIRNYKKNEYIYHQGDDADRFFIIINGWIRLYRETIDGDETVSDLLTKGDIFGEGIIFYQSNHYIFSAQTAEETRLLEIPKSILKYRAEENPDILKRIMASVCKKMIKLQTENERLASMNAAQRVACLLLRLSAEMLGNGGTFTFPYDKSLAAAQLGMKRETFSRALMHLKSLGVTVKGAEIMINSFQQLTEFSCKHCALSPDQCAGARFSSSEFKDMWTKPAINSHNSHDA